MIEDTEDSRQVECRALQQAGYETKSAGSAEEGFQFAQSSSPDLILCDILMGGEDGFALLERLRNTPATATIPVILMAADHGSSSEDGRRRGMALGADDFLRKPFAPDILLTSVKARLQKKALEQSQAARTQACLVQILESTVDLTLLVEAETLQVIYVNHAGRRLFGLPATLELDGQFLAPLFTPASLTLLSSDIFPTARQGNAWQGELVLRSPAGREVPVSAVVLSHQTGEYDQRIFSIVAHDISRRRELEKNLRENEAYLKTIFASIKNGIVIADATTNTIIEVNDAVVRLTGRSKLSLVGKPFHTLARKEEEPIQAAADLSPLSNSNECLLLDQQGRGIAALRSSVPILLRGRLCLLECFTDISAQKQIEAQLRDSEIRFSTIATATFDGMVMADPTGRISFWNPAAERILGYTAAEAIGQDLHRLIAPARYHQAAIAGLGMFAKTGQGAAVGQSLELCALRKDGKEIAVELSLSAVAIDEQWHAIGIMRDISLRKQADATLQLAHAAMDAAANGVAITDIKGTIIWINQAFTTLTGYSAEEAIGQNPRVLQSGQHEGPFYENLWRTISSGQIWQGELCNRRKDGTLYHEEMTITPVRQNGQVTHFIAIKQDIAARKQAEEERQQMEVQLRQAQKLESIGQLAAGIAHEINTPVQFVGDNVRFVNESLPHFALLLTLHRELLEAARATATNRALVEKAEASLQASDLDYLIRELPTAVKESLDGIDRIAHIVRAMKEFSHPSSKDRAPVDLNRAIESTVTVARNEWKYVADLTLDLEPTLPSVPCYASEINQVVLNLVVNASHTIADVVRAQPGTKGKITIRTRGVEGAVEVQIADTGAGIPEAIRHRIFDPFFTTKEVGKGTGQGLTMAHNTIVKRHGGSMRFESSVGQGTTFFIRLPLMVATSNGLIETTAAT